MFLIFKVSGYTQQNHQIIIAIVIVIIIAAIVVIIMIIGPIIPFLSFADFGLILSSSSLTVAPDSDSN